MAAWTDIELERRNRSCAGVSGSWLRIVVGLALGVKALVYFVPGILPVSLGHAFILRFPNMATTAINAMLLMLAVFMVMNCKTRVTAILALAQFGALMMLAGHHLLVFDHLIVAVFIVGGLVSVLVQSSRNQSERNAGSDPSQAAEKSGTATTPEKRGNFLHSFVDLTKIRRDPH